MKGIARLVLVALLSLATVGFETSADAGPASTDRDFEIDLSLVGASPPASGFHKAFGANIGAGLMLNEAETLQGRIDVSPLKWDRSSPELYYTRLSVVLSGRYYVQTYSDVTRFYLQAGVEVSFDEVESIVTPFPLVKTATRETNIGVTPGFGWEIGLGPNLGLILGGRYHIITDNYFDLMAGLAVYF